MQVWSPRDTYVNHHEVTNLLVDLPEDGPMRDSIFAIMRVRQPPGCPFRPLHAAPQSTSNVGPGGHHVTFAIGSRANSGAELWRILAVAVALKVRVFGICAPGITMHDSVRCRAPCNGVRSSMIMPAPMPKLCVDTRLPVFSSGNI